MNTQEFKFENGLTIRVPFIEDETSWFVASDACDILNINDTRRAVERLDNDEKRKAQIISGDKIVKCGSSMNLDCIN